MTNQHFNGGPHISIHMPVPSNVFKDNSYEFKEQYRDAKELLPHNMPQPRGNSVRITAYVDSDHASNQQTRKSHMGHIVFINRAPIIFYQPFNLSTTSSIRIHRASDKYKEELRVFKLTPGPISQC